MGTVPDAITSALSGLNSAEARLEKTTARLARVADTTASSDQVSLTDEMINLLLAKKL